MKWTKTPEVNGHYWYRDNYMSEEENLNTIARVTITGESNLDIVAINGGVYYLEGIRDDLPWFYGPIQPPTIPCPGSDGYHETT